MWKPLALLCLLLPVAGLAQFRPPPMSPAQRLVLQGDEARADAARIAAEGDAKGSRARLEEAAELYTEALSADPDSIPAAIGLGQALGSLKKWEALVVALKPAAERFKDDVDLTFSVGQALLKLNRTEEARPFLAVAAASSRKDVCLVHYYMGWLALNAEDGVKASKELTRYLADRPPEMAAADGQVQELLGRAWLLQADPVEARKAYEAALAAQPASLSAQLGMEAVLELEGRTAEAISLLQGMIVRHPTAPEPKERLAWLLLARGEIAEAERLANALAATGGKTPKALMGNIRLAQNAVPEAETLLRQAVEELPDFPAALTALARAVQLQGRHAEAVKLLEAAVEKHPRDAALLAALGSTQRRGGNARQALATHKKVLFMRPHDAQGWRMVAADQYALEDWNEAIAAYEQVLDLAPADERAAFWIAQALLHRARGHLTAARGDAAVADLQRAHKVLPGPQTARAHGAGLLALARYEEAEKVLSDATLSPGASWQEQQLLGYARLGLKKPETAVRTFEAAARLATTPEEKSQIEAGWALADLQLGNVDAAVAKLSGSPAGAPNLPLAHLRRALQKASAGDAVTAEKDLDAADRLLRGDASGRLRGLAELTRGMVRVEQGRFADALAAFGRALSDKEDQPERLFAMAYVEYRRNRSAQARKFLAQVQKVAPSREVNALGLAISQRELETLYRKGELAKAEQVLKEAADAKSAWYLHNRACVDYRRGRTKAALVAWERTANTVPESALNLGLHAHAKEKDARRAVDWYGRYLSSRGASYASTVREWRERLEMLHGLSAQEESGR